MKRTAHPPPPGWLFQRLGLLTVTLADRPRVRPLVNAIVQAWFTLLSYERSRGGHRLWGFSREFLIRYGRARALRMADRLQAHPDQRDDLAKIQDLEDRPFAVTGCWIITEQTHAVKHETQCPFAEKLKACPEICSDLIRATEAATFTTLIPVLNPRSSLAPLITLLSKGHDHRAFVHTLNDNNALEEA